MIVYYRFLHCHNYFRYIMLHFYYYLDLHTQIILYNRYNIKTAKKITSLNESIIFPMNYFHLFQISKCHKRFRLRIVISNNCELCVLNYH